MKHKHAHFIKLMADGVRIESRELPIHQWNDARWIDFSQERREFRISPNQPPDEEGWIQWFGGEAPAISERIDVRFKNWPTQENTTAGQWRWEISDRETDIVAYRIHKEPVKVVLYQWAIWINSDNYPLLTTRFYKDEDDLNRAFQNLKKSVRADWTRIEVEAAE